MSYVCEVMDDCSTSRATYFHCCFYRTLNPCEFFLVGLMFFTLQIAYFSFNLLFIQLQFAVVL